MRVSIKESQESDLELSCAGTGVRWGPDGDSGDGDGQRAGKCCPCRVDRFRFQVFQCLGNPGLYCGRKESAVCSLEAPACRFCTERESDKKARNIQCLGSQAQGRSSNARRRRWVAGGRLVGFTHVDRYNGLRWRYIAYTNQGLCRPGYSLLPLPLLGELGSDMAAVTPGAASSTLEWWVWRAFGLSVSSPCADQSIDKSHHPGRE
jgi:hypothetical protein